MIDSHIHLDDPRFDGQRQRVVQQARDVGVDQFVVPATTSAGFDKVASLPQQFAGVYVAYGLHPYFIDQHTDEDLQAVAARLKTRHCVAVGECGLDFYVPALKQQRQRQETLFLAQIELAKQYDMPLIIHARKAVGRVLACLQEVGYWQGVIHSYHASLEQTRQVLDKGLRVGFGGAATRPNAHKLRQVVAYVPDTALLLETDAPDQPPWSHRGEINKPAYLSEIAECIAAIRQQPVVTLVKQTDANARALFALPPAGG